ncbi:MAG: toll/interleukin-1 receptor domain-containing protein [Anaerolineae bacterium]|nr:toll/interleukin-1 receptor domain-containing protein [Anaerolineae bacterium]
MCNYAKLEAVYKLVSTMIQIFISYSRRDRQFAQQLSESLHTVGLGVWIDLQDIHAGSKWGEAIQEGLDNSQAMIVVISPDSMNSENVKDEWQYFFDHKKPIIPVLFRPAKVHFQLNRIQHIDFHSQSYDAAFTALCEQLEHRLAMDNLRNLAAAQKVKSGIPLIVRRYGVMGAALVLLVFAGVIVNRGVLLDQTIPTITPTAQVEASSPDTILTLASNSPQNLALATSDFQVAVIIPFAFLRTGPGVQFEALATALENEVFPIIGQAPGFNVDNESITWYMIKHTSDRDLWISSEVVSVTSISPAAGGAGIQQLTMEAPVRTPPTIPTIAGGGGDD